MKKLFNLYKWDERKGKWEYVEKLQAFTAKQARYVFARRYGYYFNDTSAQPYSADILKEA